MLTLSTLPHFTTLKSSTPLLIVDFYATWCGPCKVISPRFDAIAKTHSTNPNVTFAQVDVDAAPDISQACGITAMPTFQFFRGGRKVDEIKGADPNGLAKKVEQWVADVAKDAPAAKTTTTSAGAGSGPGSLRSLIDVPNSRLANATLLSSVANVVSPPPAGYALASSTTGKPLLIHLAFKSAILPSSVTFRVPPSADKKTDPPAHAPSKLHISANVPVKFTTDKEGVESNDLGTVSLGKGIGGGQEVKVFSDEWSGGKAVVRLKGSRFGAGEGGVKSITLGIEGVIGGEGGVCKIAEMDILGVKA